MEIQNWKIKFRDEVKGPWKQVFDKIFFRIIKGWMACNCIKEIAKERSAKFSINKETAHSMQIRKQ